jgi:DNA-binding CsgD family transcriptional regulator
VLHGEPGAGKSALLAWAGDSSGVRVLHTRGIESESPLAFAALHRLLRPVLHLVDRLPEPQALALREAFGQASPTGGSDRFLVFLATLSLLSDQAEQDPLLCLIDDAQWLDDASAAALLFVARRVEVERIALLFAARDGDVRRFDSGDLQSLQVAGLEGPAAETLLREGAGMAVPASVCQELVRRTGGNPLALLELPGALSGAQLAGAMALPPHLPLTDGVERVFLNRSRALPPGAQKLLLIAAADDSGRYKVLRTAAKQLDLTEESFEAAERSNLLKVQGSEVELRHPLVRSAIYGAATSVERRMAHRALAEAFTSREDFERRAWHQAAAVAETDEAVAAALEAVAVSARRRGGHEAASAAAERAADLSPEDEPKAARLYLAADSAWLAGAPNRARTLAQAARLQTRRPLLIADLDRLRARVEWNYGSPQVGHGILMRAAQEVAGHDPNRASEMAMIATAVASFGGDSGVRFDRQALLSDLERPRSERAECLGRLLECLESVVGQDLARAAPALRAAFALSDHLDEPDLLSNIGIAAMHLGEDSVGLTVHSRLLASARENSAVARILYALTRRSFTEIATGRWQAAGAASFEALNLATSINQPGLTALPHAWLLLLDAFKGEESFESQLSRAEEAIQAHPAGILAPAVSEVIRWARGVHAAPTDGHLAFHQLAHISNPIMQRLAVIDRIEAAVRAGQRDQARQWTEEIGRFAAATQAPWAAAAAAHGRAVTLDSDPLDGFEEALAHHRRSPRLFNRARTELAFGEYLRRSRQRVRAREHLRSALEAFEDLQARPWAARAREELRASGETARRRSQTDTPRLTAQELQVAQLVQQGLSNREVAERLYVSPRTVDFHLRNIFSKLGISSRAALAGLQLAQEATTG